MDTAGQRAIPYYSQWETPDMTLDVVAEGAAKALLRDPLWAASGAVDVEQYALWAANICGMACMKMVLAARTGEVLPTVKLAMQCKDFGGYVVEPGGAIKGLIYASFVRFAKALYGIDAAVMTGITARDIPDILAEAEFFMASVHPGIRWPEIEPPSKGGHLVLVTAATGNVIRFHNPSGHDRRARENAELLPEIFDRFFAGRGIVIGL